MVLNDTLRLGVDLVGKYSDWVCTGNRKSPKRRRNTRERNFWIDLFLEHMVDFECVFREFLTKSRAALPHG